MSDDDFKVTSEVLQLFDKDTDSTPLVNATNVVSKLTFTLPCKSGLTQSDIPEKDDDGDYVLLRKNSENLQVKVIILEHSISTELQLVGLQIWRAALLLADFIIFSQELFKNKVTLELGSGVGLTAIVAGMFAKQVICTDINLGKILQLIESNINRNISIVKAKVDVEELNFFSNDWPDRLHTKIQRTEIVLAADVIYDNDVTEAFIRTIIKILGTQPKKTLYLALEKRYVFTQSDLKSVAPMYEHLKLCLQQECLKAPCSQWIINELKLDFPQYFKYERTKELVLIEISS